MSAIIFAELSAILLLILVVFVYGFVKPPDSPSPEEFAPRAGMWVGPIGGFLATLLFARWVGRRAGAREVVHGAAVGVGAALLDFNLGLLLGGVGAIQPIFFISNAGRILAGLLGGLLVQHKGSPAPVKTPA